MPIYVALMFAISSGGLLAIGGLGGLSGATWQSDPRLPLFFLAMLAGPSIAALRFANIERDRLTIAFRTYMPGVVTAVSITLPVSAMLLRRARREAWVSTPVFWAVIPIAALVHGPVLGVFLRSTIAIFRLWTSSGVA